MKNRNLLQKNRSIAKWLTSGKARTSTPAKDDGLPLGVPQPVSAKKVSVSLSSAEKSGYSADISESNSSVVMSPTERAISFETTTSSFLQNVDSFCQDSQPVREPSVPSVPSATADSNGIEFVMVSGEYRRF